MIKRHIDNFKYKWNKLDIEDRLAVITGLVAISLMISPIRNTLIIICLCYLALYIIIKTYRHIKERKRFKGK